MSDVVLIPKDILTGTAIGIKRYEFNYFIRRKDTGLWFGALTMLKKRTKMAMLNKCTNAISQERILIGAWHFQGLL